MIATANPYLKTTTVIFLSLNFIAMKIIFSPKIKFTKLQLTLQSFTSNHYQTPPPQFCTIYTNDLEYSTQVSAIFCIFRLY